MTNEEAIKDFEQQNKLLLGIRTTASQETYERNLVAIEALKAKKVGKWIVLKDEYGDIHEAICSCCDSNGNHKWNYCPNCGAKMAESEGK